MEVEVEEEVEVEVGGGGGGQLVLGTPVSCGGCTAAALA